MVTTEDVRLCARRNASVVHGRAERDERGRRWPLRRGGPQEQELEAAAEVLARARDETVTKAKARPAHVDDSSAGTEDATDAGAGAAAHKKRKGT
jgi:predicted Zn-dependent protease